MFGSLLILISSCKTNKDMVYLHNTKDLELIEGIHQVAPIYKVKENDNLYVDIQSLSVEINALFNPTSMQGKQSGISQNYGTQSSQYLNGYQVDLSGNITLPLIGKINVLGKSVESCQFIIQKKASEFIKDATVKCKLLSYKITVLGEVKNPGVYYNYSSSITVLDAISMAKGITDFAHIKKVLVVRQTVKGTRSFRLNLTDKRFLSSEAYFLLPDDVLYVQPDKYKSVKINSTFYSLLLSSVSTLILILNVIK